MKQRFDKLDPALDFAGWVEKTIRKQAVCLVANLFRGR